MVIDLTKNKINAFVNKAIQSRYPGKRVYVSNGWIDSHVHLFANSKYNLSFEHVQKLKGVIAYIDAGSSGVNNFELAIKINKVINARIFYLLNVASNGIVSYPEIQNGFIDYASFKQLATKYSSIIGFKMRYSPQAIGQNGFYKSVMKQLERIPVLKMYHIGNSPPLISDLLPTLQSHDIITHYAHGKNDDFLKAYGDVQNKKIHLDLGAGSESLSLEQLKRFIQKGIYPDSLSTDLHNGSWTNQSCRINRQIELFLELGLSVDQIMPMVTTNPLENYIKLKRFPSYYETNTIFEVVDQIKTFTDSHGITITTKKAVNVLGVYDQKLKWY